MITYSEYMNDSSNLHNAYMAQFVTESTKAWVKSAIGLEKLKRSIDKHFNDIPLERWDMFFKTQDFSAISRKIKESGSTNAYTLCYAVCVAKQAAYMLMDSHTSKRRAIKITLENSDTITTEVNGTRNSILEYYGLGCKYQLGKAKLNIGDGAGNDNVQAIKSLEFLDEAA